MTTHRPSCPRVAATWAAEPERLRPCWCPEGGYGQGWFPDTPAKPARTPDEPDQPALFDLTTR